MEVLAPAAAGNEASGALPSLESLLSALGDAASGATIPKPTRLATPQTHSESVPPLNVYFSLGSHGPRLRPSNKPDLT